MWNYIIGNSFHIRIWPYALCKLHVIYYYSNIWSKLASKNALGPVDGRGSSSGSGSSDVGIPALPSLSITYWRTPCLLGPACQLLNGFGHVRGSSSVVYSLCFYLLRIKRRAWWYNKWRGGGGGMSVCSQLRSHKRAKIQDEARSIRWATWRVQRAGLQRERKKSDVQSKPIDRSSPEPLFTPEPLLLGLR